VRSHSNLLARVAGFPFSVAFGCVIAFFSAAPANAQLEQRVLDNGWQVRAVESAEHPEATGWRPATVPGTVQTDLRNSGAIPDPFIGDNEKRLQWIGLTDWEYSRTIEVTPGMLRHGHLDLVFEGLDTFADVLLNSTPLLSTNNMFRSWRVEAKQHLHAGPNTLTIVFHSPTERITAMVEKLPYIIPGTGYEQLDRSAGIYPVSHYMRKAAYSYGWDWGPKLVTEGIWRPVRLELWDDTRLESLHIRQQSVTSDRAVLEASLALSSDLSGKASLRMEIKAPDGRDLLPVVLPVRLDRGENVIEVPLRIEHPERWFPNGYGPQNQYHFTALLRQGSRILLRQQRMTGLRSVELSRQPDQWGTSFAFVINGIPIFAKGANLVPLDSFPPDTTDAKRRAILTAARDVHMNMLRIWGGGFYETDSFYDLCDELGLMVWHDFMFGGAMVPGDKDFQDNVRAEAAEQVERLSDHPSLTLWCGNNEVETAWHNWGDQIAFQKSVTPAQREQVWQDYVVMFRDILKSTTAQYGNGVPYWPSSPGANFDDVPTGQEDGDEHSWSVWSAGAPPSDYRMVHARFISEFGFQSMPELRTVRAFAGDDQDLDSPALANHERFIHGYDRMRSYIKEEFGPARDFASFIYLSQIMQAEAVRTGVEHWRSQRPETMGTLYWQLDDCWPVASWSSLDYFGQWKALHYYAARFYAPLLIAAETDGAALQVHVVSDELQRRDAVLHLHLMRFDGAVIEDRRLPLSVLPLSSTALPKMQLVGLEPRRMAAVLTLEEGRQEIARTVVYFAHSRDLALPAANLTTTIEAGPNAFVVELRSPVLCRAVSLDFGDLEVKPEDNFFDLLPNEPRRVRITGKASLEQMRAALHVRSLVDAMQPAEKGQWQ
jgi:beta-mannosidase